MENFVSLNLFLNRILSNEGAETLSKRIVTIIDSVKVAHQNGPVNINL
jgi:hypothetical protein